MTDAAAARARRRTPDPRKATAIALSDSAAAKRSRVSRDWRHAMSMRTRLFFRRFFVFAALSLPFLAAAAGAAEPLRAVRELNVMTPARAKLFRLLRKLRSNRSLIDAGVRTNRMTAGEAEGLRRDLAAIERKARALARREGGLLDKNARALDSEIERLGRKIRT